MPIRVKGTAPKKVDFRFLYEKSDPAIIKITAHISSIDFEWKKVLPLVR